jgi:hypothetical protein
MKYVMLFASGAEDARAAMPAERYEAIHAEIMEWWGTHSAAGTIVGGERLQPAATATTIRGTNGSQSVTDGPFIEAKEEVSGYGLIEVADLDAALALARTWPALQIPGDSVEVRPVFAM